MSSPQIWRVRKVLVLIFKYCGLNITWFIKKCTANNVHIYINKPSNHSKTARKQIQESTEKRLSETCSNESNKFYLFTINLRTNVALMEIWYACLDLLKTTPLTENKTSKDVLTQIYMIQLTVLVQYQR